MVGAGLGLELLIGALMFHAYGAYAVLLREEFGWSKTLLSAAVAGIGGNALSNLVPPLGLRGVYRSTNATLAAGSVTVCTQCAARRNIEADDLISGIRIAGAATFVAEITAEGAQALVYLPRCSL